MMIILILLSMAVLSIEVAYESSLSHDIKKSLKLDVTPQIIEAMTRIGFWNKLWSKYLFPISLVFLVLASIYKRFVQLLNCQYCISVWLTTISMYLYSDNIINSMLYGLITIPVVHLLEKYVYS